MGGLSAGKRCPHFGNFMISLNFMTWGLGDPHLLGIGDFQGNMSVSLDNLTGNLKKWNKTTYGHIATRKRSLIHKLSTVYKKIDLLGANHLTPVELEIRNEFENVLHYEELF
ncbi:hypothetical protein PVK06_029043 [Gossypium arboreum]|uniref:Uncharacterized protein n=1 Tax=Gossypium arboreum TaxID=29729 RepID=A0ABR0P5J6_GOSAR|nr:hypothetical protein PVK06_029043 [Gossypium arboreum]